MLLVALRVYFVILYPVVNYIFLIYNGFIKLIKIILTKRQHMKPSEARKQAERGEAKRGGAFTRGEARHACDASTIARQRPPTTAPASTAPANISPLYIFASYLIRPCIILLYSTATQPAQHRQPATPADKKPSGSTQKNHIKIA